MASNVTRDHHNLRRNLKLNGNYLSNDGDDEGISINDGGTINIVPANTSKSAISINHDYGDTTAAYDIATLKIDFDQDSSTSNAMTSKGIDLNMLYGASIGGAKIMYGTYINCQLTSASGTGSCQTFGIYSRAVGNQTGLVDQTTGGQFIATGGDINTGIDITADDGGEDLIIRSSAAEDDWFKLQVEANGLTTLSTQEYGGGSTAHLNIVPDGNVGIGVADPDALLEIFGTSTQLKLSYDATDYASLTVAANGATTMTTVDDSGATAHLTVVADGHVEFDGCAAGFDLEEPTFNPITTIVDFRKGNKQLVTFDNGSITNLSMYFPKTSGNFVVLVKQDGTGGRTISNYRTYDADVGNAGAVKFPGGVAPDLTDDANFVDIISVFWDANHFLAYGVATLNFDPS